MRFRLRSLLVLVSALAVLVTFYGERAVEWCQSRWQPSGMTIGFEPRSVQTQLQLDAMRVELQFRQAELVRVRRVAQLIEQRIAQIKQLGGSPDLIGLLEAERELRRLEVQKLQLELRRMDKKIGQ